MKLRNVNLRNISIKRKLTLMAMLTSTVALVLTSVSFLIYDLISFRHLLSQDLIIQTEMIAYNSAAAMAFRDEASAKATLSALTAKEDVVSAILYDTEGAVFARYTRASEAGPEVSPDRQEKGYRFTDGHIEVFSDVILRGERVGSLYLQSDMRQWNIRARRYAGILCIFVMISALIAWLVSSKLQNVVSRPILLLEQAMRAVSRNKNYAVRAKKFYDDEIGQLIDGFNTMLAEIQNRDKALQCANDNLKEQTRELEEEITHHKRTQEELLKAKQAAEDANRAKSSFLANMSHELRTPLNAIIGYSEMLEEESRDSGHMETVQDLQRIQAAGKHLLALINDVLDLSKIEAGKMGLSLEHFDVRQMIEEMVTTLKPAAEKNSNRLEVYLADDVGIMRADIVKVRQILFNLLSNACKFTDHGMVELHVERKTVRDRDWIQFRVIDDGIGITPEQQWNLFQEFSQADGSIARKYGGTGLGLAISSRFVQLMNGHIGVDSEPGEGSTFTVELPAMVAVETAEPVESPEVEAPAAIAAEAKPDADTVLVIDDDASVRDLMSRFLTKQGFHVVAATSGEEGLRLAKELRPRIITLDVVMPGLNGWSVLSQLKSDPELESIHVIVVSIVDNEVMGFELGASNYLVKPVDRDRLALLLEKYRSPIADGDRRNQSGVKISNSGRN